MTTTGIGIDPGVFAAIPGLLFAVIWAAAITAALAWWASSGLVLPYGWTALWIAGPGVLPVLAASYAHHRSLGWTGMAARVGAVTGIALLGCAIGAFLVERTGFAAYRPPVWPPRRLAGGRYGRTARAVQRRRKSAGPPSAVRRHAAPRVAGRAALA